MTPEQFAQLQSELWQIKVAVIVTGAGIICLCALAAHRMYVHVKRYVTNRLGEMFRDSANDLLEKGDIAGLKAAALDMLKSRPNHADAHWYLARAYYLEADLPRALAEFEATRKLMPYWDAEYVKPYVTEIERLQSRTT